MLISVLSPICPNVFHYPSYSILPKLRNLFRLCCILSNSHSSCLPRPHCIYLLLPFCVVLLVYPSLALFKFPSALYSYRAIQLSYYESVLFLEHSIHIYYLLKNDIPSHL